MTVEEAVYHLLTTDAGVSSLLASRIYPGQAPQSDTLPVLVYTQSSREATRNVAGEVRSLTRHGLRLDSWGRSYSEIRQVYDSVLDCLLPFAGLVTVSGRSLRIQHIGEEGGEDGAEPPIHAEESGLWHCGIDLSIWYGDD